MKKLMHIIILSCKKATELIEKKSCTKLSIKENIQLHFHKSICDACSTYEVQSKQIDSILSQQIINSSDNKIDILENQSLKELITKKINQL